DAAELMKTSHCQAGWTCFKVPAYPRDGHSRKGAHMSRPLFGILAVGVGVLVGVIPAWAHHSFAAAFDANKPVTVRGVITEIRLENPRSWFFLDVTDATGRAVAWA